MIHGATQALQAHGSAPALAKEQAYGLIAANISRQALVLSYLDTFVFCLRDSVPVPVVSSLRNRGAAAGLFRFTQHR